MGRFFSTVAVRLAFRFSLVLSVAILVLSVAFVGVVQSFSIARQNSELVDAAGTIERMIVRRAMGEIDLPRARRRTESSNPREEFRPPPKNVIPYYISFVVSTADGLVLSTNDPLLPVLEETNGKIRHHFQRNFFIDGNLSIRYFSKKVEIDGKTLVIQTSRDIEREDAERFASAIFRAALLVTSPILIFSFLISLLITKNTMKPVVRITRAASKISSSSLDTQLSLSGTGDEIDELASAFNSLFSRLNADFERERQFTSDVSHELKTPVAVVLGQANLLLRWGKDDAGQLEKSLLSIRKEAKSMESIIANLLQISRIENGRITPKSERVEFLPLFSRIRDEFAHIAPLVSFDISAGEECAVRSDFELLHQVLTVVVSNSVRYAGEECAVSLKAERCCSSVVVFADDDGPGFSGDVLPHVFERFFRGDKAHNRADGGSGLGLSIALVIIGALGGIISAENVVPHGARIRIEIPFSGGDFR